MAKYIDYETLLHDKRVRAEIDRHLWIESEKQGRDIGLDQAREEWLKNFSKVWMSYHMPDAVLKNGRAPAEADAAPKKTPKRRSAKSYIK